MSQLVPFENDLKSLQLYVELEQMRYADKFMVVYNIQKQIKEGDYLIPPMIIQPFVENAIIHGEERELDRLPRALEEQRPGGEDGAELERVVHRVARRHLIRRW